MRLAPSVLLLVLASCGGAVSETAVDEPASVPVSVPAQTMGARVVGQPASEWLLDGWLRGEPRSVGGLRGSVVLVRFFTNTCPFCASSMPALQGLHERYVGQGLVVLGFYHPKPLGADRPRSSVEALLDEWGVTFPVALDTRWRTLRRYWLDAADRRATSASFLIDRSGLVTHVHPGPELHGPDAACTLDAERCAADFAALEAAVEDALGR